MLVAFVMVPSPQLMFTLVSGKSLSVAPGLASVKVATSPEKTAPSTAVVTGVAVAVSAASATVNAAAFEATPEFGFSTATLQEPSSARLAAGTVAVSLPLLTQVVASAVPFHRTTALLSKFEPLMVSVKGASPSVARFWLSVVIIGGE